MNEVLMFAPSEGSFWMTDCYEDYCAECGEIVITGEVWEAGGGWNMPDDYQGEYITMHYPKQWAKKLPATLPPQPKPKRAGGSDVSQAN